MRPSSHWINPFAESSDRSPHEPRHRVQDGPKRPPNRGKLPHRMSADDPSWKPRSPRLGNPDQLRRGERYRQTSSLKGVKIGRRYGVRFASRLTLSVLDSTVGMVGDLQAIAGKAMPEIPSLDTPLLEDEMNFQRKAG